MTKAREVATQGGLVLITSQTIGTAVSSVVVNNAFSSTYDNYRIVLTGNLNSATGTIGLSLGSTATGYYSGGYEINYGTSAGTIQVNNNTSSWTRPFGGTTAASGSNSLDLFAPFLSIQTTYSALRPGLTTTGNSGFYVGMLNNTTSYTNFTLTPSTGTITGGTISVYGYKK
jgi:hypothetical protein